MKQKPRPIIRERKGVTSIMRNPGEGYFLPRLRERDRNTQAVGFHVRHVGGDWDKIE